MKTLRPIQFEHEPAWVRAFLRLPRRLYGHRCTENADETRQLLLGTHPLSKYFTLHKFLILDETAAPVGRFALTVYPDDTNAYLGFFECIDDPDAADCLFGTARDFAISHGFQKLVGPVDASFWIKYRLKINLFDKPPYTGEPYNLPYYFRLFSEHHFTVTEHYTSNIYPTISPAYPDDKFTERYHRFLEQGYRIEPPQPKDYPALLQELYALLTALYSDFPVFKPLSQEDFIATFSGYLKVVDPSMLRFAFYEGKMVGFFISVPNFGNLTARLTPQNILKILQIKRRPREYVMLYMGVDPAHRGLGKAISGAILQELKQNGLPSIGALTRDGKVTQNYASDLIDDRYEYVLMEDTLQ